MEWVAAIIGVSGCLFLVYSIPLFFRAYDLWKIRKDFASLPVSSIQNIKKSSGKFRIKGKVGFVDDPLFSLLDETKGVYFKMKIYPRSRKKFIKSWQDKRFCKFSVTDDSGASAFIYPENGRFIIFHRDITSELFDNCKKQLIPENWRENLDNADGVEEFLTDGKNVSVIGDFVQEDGQLVVKADKSRTFVVAECSDEAFSLLHLRFFVRIVFLCASMFLTGCLQLYMLFFVILSR